MPKSGLALTRSFCLLALCLLASVGTASAAQAPEGPQDGKCLRGPFLLRRVARGLDDGEPGVGEVLRQPLAS